MTDAQIKVVRPTEAQLRWAAFRFKHQAVQVRESIHQLWQTPADVRNVEGAFSEDGITTEESSGADDFPRRPKPKISRGRRALLRVSKRKFEKRRVEIERSGFAGDRPEEGIGHEDNTLEALFAGESIQKRRRRRRKNHRGGKEADRVRRFEAAFHSMMKNFEASQEPKYVIETPSKIWRRPEGADSFDSLDYSALKMGSQQKINNPRLRLSDLPADKSASWLVHLPPASSNVKQHPSHSKAACNTPNAQHNFSPVRQRFRKIVTEFQCVKSPQPNPAADAPTKNVAKYFVPSDGDEYNESMPQKNDFLQTPSQNEVLSKAAVFERRYQTEEQLEAVFRSMDPDLLKEMEELDPGVSDRLRALYLGEDSPRLPVKDIAERLEQKTPRSSTDDIGFVNQFVDSIEHAIQSRQEELVAADGKLQKAAFATLVNQYLVKTGNRSKAGKPGLSAANEGKVSAIAESFMSKIDGADEADYALDIMDSTGSFDKSAFRDLVTRYLSDASGVEEHIVEQAEDLESLANQSTTVIENDGHVLTISRQLASDLVAQIESQNRNDSYGTEVSVRRTVQEFFVSNCGVQIEEFDGDDIALTNAVWRVQDDILRFISNSLLNQANSEQLANRLCSHFVEFFEGSMYQERERAEYGDKVDLEIIPKAFVADLIQKVQQVSNIERVVRDDGLLDVGKVSGLMKRYLAARTTSTGAGDETILQLAQSPLALAQVRRFASNRPSRQCIGDKSVESADLTSLDEKTSSKFLQIYIQNLESNAYNRDLRKSDGRVDEGRLVRLLKESSETAQQIINEESASLIKALQRKEKHAASSIVSELTYDPGDEKKLEDNQKVGTLVKSVKQKFGGFVKRLYNAEHGESDSDVKIYKAFRKSHEGQKDDTSSHASFFPEGIRSAVQKIGGRGMEATKDSNEGQSNGDKDLRAGPIETRSGEMDSEFSPPTGKYLSNIIGDDIIDTDGSAVGDLSMQQERLKNLTLSPALLAKRHRQAIRCIEKRQWKEIQYLLNANPWLAEMSDANTRQYLLHKLALYGAGKGVLNEDEAYEIQDAAPLQVNTNLVRLFPSSVHKFDQEGNLPLHMAAASANVSMAQLLGDRFPSGATVRNEDGLLPVHLAILACASPLTSGYGNADNAREMVQTILGYFPGAIAVTDNDGNLPIHTAATVLRGDVGVDVVYMLYDEAQRQLKDPYGARFKNKLKLEDLENMSMGTEDTETPTVTSNNFDDALQCTLVRNDLGWTPVFCAIHSCAKWEVIDALVQGPDGDKSAIETDEDGNNALHLLLDERYLDPTSALSVLKAAPKTACARNHDGMLPIELACMHGLPFDLIMAMVLVDLPIEIDNKDSPQNREGFGASWWFIACDTDDHYIEIVDEILSMCSIPQIRELAYMKNSTGDTLVSMAAPDCKEILQSALRYVGRFEIKDEIPIADSSGSGISIFEAVDFGYAEDGLEEGIDVYLKFFDEKVIYDTETKIIRDLDLEFSLVEEVFAFDIEDMKDDAFDASKKFCLCIEKPRLTLASVVAGMLRNEDCQNDPRIRSYYNAKALAVLRAVAKGLLHLHTIGVIHGNLSPTNVGKYDTIWKIAGMSGVQKIGETFESRQFHGAIPPEALCPEAKFGSSTQKVQFRSHLLSSAAIDVWGFGQLAYEVLVGQPLVASQETEGNEDNQAAMGDVMQWNDFNLEVVKQDLKAVGVAQAAAELICDCLHPEPGKRPNANGILAHEIWQQLRRKSEESSQLRPDEQEI